MHFRQSDAKFVAIAEDAAILDLAQRRLAALGAVASFLQCGFLETALRRRDAVVASLALHHARTAERKQELDRDCHDAIATGGLLIRETRV